MSQSAALPGNGVEPAGDYVSAAGMAPVRVAGGGIRPPHGGFGFEEVETWVNILVESLTCK